MSKKIVFVFVLLIIFSCNNNYNVELPKAGYYHKFKHVKDITAKNGEKTNGYELLEDSVTNNERKILLEILEEFGWKYEITKNNEVFISVVALVDMENLYFLDSELEKRIRNNKGE